MKRILLLIAVILLVGCRSQKTPSVTDKFTVKDSSVVKLVPVDTIIKIPPRSIKLSTPLERLSEVPVTRTKENTRISVSRVGDQINAECDVEELEAKISLQNKIIENYKHTDHVRTETIVEEVKYIPWIIKILAWIGGLSLLYFGWKLFRFIQSFTNPISFLR